MLITRYLAIKIPEKSTCYERKKLTEIEEERDKNVSLGVMNCVNTVTLKHNPDFRQLMLR